MLPRQNCICFLDDLYGSIESLDVHKNESWRVIVKLNQLRRRSEPAVAIIDEQTIVVFGGV